MPRASPRSRCPTTASCSMSIPRRRWPSWPKPPERDAGAAASAKGGRRRPGGLAPRSGRGPLDAAQDGADRHQREAAGLQVGEPGPDGLERLLVRMADADGVPFGPRPLLEPREAAAHMVAILHVIEEDVARDVRHGEPGRHGAADA